MPRHRTTDAATIVVPDLETLPFSDDRVRLEYGSTLDVGQSVGRYEIVGVLGQGGMGVVYDAHDPKLQRGVALKVLPLNEHSSTTAQRRLLREAQAMARINHPNVVSVHDVGLCPSGVYVAMERIDGLTVSDWIHSHNPARSEILDVYSRVIEGLHAVHEAGLTHRDIKPANIMVAGIDQGPPARVAVMDLGLAADPGRDTLRSASGETTTSGSVSLTHTGALVGTPAYMAPELFTGAPADARSDQFSLCVSIYESLLGARPFAGRTPHAVALNASQGTFAPLPAGTPRLSTTLQRTLTRGLRADPQDRWPHLTDLRSHLHQGLRPRWRRQGWALAAATAGLAAWGANAKPVLSQCVDTERALAQVWSQADRQRWRAQSQADPEGKHAWTAISNWEQDWAAAVSDACDGRSPAAAPPPAALDLDRRLHCLERQRLDLAASVERWTASTSVPAQQIAEETSKLPTPGACLHGPGRPTDAISPETRDLLERRLAHATATARAGQYPQARQLAAEVMKSARQAGATGIETDARFELGYAQILSAQFEDAADTLETTFWQASAHRDPTLAARAASMLTYLHTQELSDLQAAQAWLRHAEAQQGRTGAGPSQTKAEILTHAALLARTRGQFAEAETLYLRTIEMHAKLYGENDVHSAAAHHNLGSLYNRLRRHDEAVERYKHAIELRQVAYGGGHPDVASSLSGLANVHRARGDYEKARELYERALEIREATLGPAHPRTLAVISGLGIIESMAGNHDGAVLTMHTVAARTQEHYGPDHPNSAQAMDNLGLALSRAGRFAEAAEQHRDAMERLQRRLGPDHFEVAKSARSLGTAYVHAGRLSDALAPLQTAVQIRKKHTPDDRRFLSDDLVMLSFVLTQLGRGTEATDPAREAVELRAGDGPLRLAEAQHALAAAWMDAGRPRPAREHARAALNTLRENKEPDDGLREEIESLLRGN